MIEYETLKQTLTQLAKLQIELDKKGGIENDGELFERILTIQDATLESFQLPLKQDYEKVIWFKEYPTDFELEERIKKLHKSAKDYLLRPATPEIKLLQNARDIGENAFDILPELKIRTHIYTTFVYEKIFLKGKDTAENILKDLRIADTNENLDALGRLVLGKNENEPKLIKQLEEKGIKYLQQFIISNSEFLTDDDY